ncbi:MAG: YoaK family protein [Stenotrophomonas sp.]
MPAPLPSWVWIGAVCLSAVAGMVNVVGFLGYEHQGLGHLTGATSQLGIALTQGDWRATGHLWGLLLAFSAGATLSGLLIEQQQLRLGRRYGLMLLIECGLLLLAIPLFARQHIAAAWVAAAACGIQNALATTFSGAIIRTTHLTGMFTDLGIGLGHLLRGLPLALRRLTLSGLIISGFLAGSMAGALLFAHHAYQALYAPALLTGTAGASYMLYSLLRRR